MQFTDKKWCVLAAKWLEGSCFHISGRLISLMVLADVKWAREPATLCSYDTLHQVFKTLGTIKQKLIGLPFSRREYERGATMSLHVTFSPGACPFSTVVMFLV